MTVGHTYVNPGTYTVNLTVWNSWGDHSHSLQDVVVTRPAVSKVFICCPDVTNIELGSEKPYYTNLRLALSPDDEPRGFSGYTVNLDINSESQWYPAKFTSATFPQWAVINEMDPPYYPGSPDWPTRTLDLKAADLNNQVGPGQWNIQLAELSINAERVGSAEIWPMVEKLNDEAGGDLVADVVPGEVHVYANVQPFYGCSESPMDLDGDSLFEDINGNGAWDYADVALYFQQMEQIHYFETIRYFDYNLNGRIDFADVIVLFHMQ
jgi:PKD repeat protein